MAFTERFLKAKHWQLFLLLFALPMIFQFTMIGVMIANIATNAPPDPMHGYFKFFPVLMIIVLGTFFGWFWSIGIGLQDKVPANVKMKTTKFKTFFFIPLFYILFILLISIVAGMATSGMADIGGKGYQPNIIFIVGIIAIIIAVHLFSMFCLFYCLYFVAKTFKTVELQRETTFSDFAGEFFMIWFYPIGIWIIQPKINKMVERGTPHSRTMESQ